MRFVLAQEWKRLVQSILDLAGAASGGPSNAQAGVKKLAEKLGAHYTVDPMVTPMMDGDRAVLKLGLGVPQFSKVSSFHGGDAVEKNSGIGG
jgi:hypothetical protein